MNRKIAIMSDLHTDIGRYDYDYKLDADIIVVAGDSAEGGDMYPLTEYVKQGKEVIYVAGNHEYYSNEINRTRLELRAMALRFGINFLDRNSINIRGIRFLGCTLWTDFNLYNNSDLGKSVVGYGMNDYRGAIKCSDAEDGYFNANLSEKLHYEDRAWLVSELNIEYTPTVVVTHHAPSFQSVHKKYRYGNDVYMNCGYASNLEHIMEKYSPKLWIHGHTHDSHDYIVNKTRVICNPRGYARYGENINWKPIVVAI